MGEELSSLPKSRSVGAECGENNEIKDNEVAGTIANTVGDERGLTRPSARVPTTNGWQPVWVVVLGLGC
ncbi:hypothetical protein V1478_013635 [Vespula squamosa]|uniref:Uncharacterized protein n=1 Tax=Vespula squamosa TaxID=30214 RepID=A0ABD2A5S0_VESSQ